jgi:hypothetical protein
VPGGWMRAARTGFMFLELLLAAAVVMFLAFAVFKLYFKQPYTNINKETQKVILEQGIDTTSYKSTVDSTRSKIEDIQNKHFEELNKIE